VLQGIEEKVGSVRLSITMELRKPVPYEVEVDFATMRAQVAGVPSAARATVVALDERYCVCHELDGKPIAILEENMLTVRLGPKGVIGGRVIDFATAPGAPSAVRLKGLKELVAPLDSAGEFHFDSVDQGLWVVQVFSERGVIPFDRKRMESIDPHGIAGMFTGIKSISPNLRLSLETKLTIAMAPGYLDTHIDLHVARAASEIAPAGLRGHVLHHDKTPAAGVKVEIYSFVAGFHFGGMPVPVGVAVTTEDGSFEFPVPPGNYTVRGSHQSFPIVYEAPVLLRNGEERDLTLVLPAPVVRELVLLNPEGVPLSGVSVKVYGPAGQPGESLEPPKNNDLIDFAITDSDGVARLRRIGVGTRTFVLGDELPPDLAVGFENANILRRVKVEVTAEAVKETLRLQRFPFVSVRAFDEYGVPAPHFSMLIGESLGTMKGRMCSSRGTGRILMHIEREGPWFLNRLTVMPRKDEIGELHARPIKVLSDPVLFARGQDVVIIYRR
jgi:hypothetical protein